MKNVNKYRKNYNNKKLPTTYVVERVISINKTLLASMLVLALLVSVGLLSTPWGHMAMGTLFAISYRLIRSVGLRPTGMFKEVQNVKVPKSYKKTLKYFNILYLGLITFPLFATMTYFIMGPILYLLVTILGLWITVSLPKYSDTLRFVKRSNKFYRKSKKNKKKGFFSKKKTAPVLEDELKLTPAMVLSSELLFMVTNFITKQLVMVTTNSVTLINKSIN